MRQTHTYAILPISESSFNEIWSKLEEAGYQHAFIQDREEGPVIDMAGIALSPIRPKPDESVRQFNKRAKVRTPGFGG
jgi:hypothetical protein